MTPSVDATSITIMVQQKLMRHSDIQTMLNIRRCGDDSDEGSQCKGRALVLLRTDSGINPHVLPGWGPDLVSNRKTGTHFVGTSANAVKVQVWTALIAMLLLRFLQLRARFSWALSNLLALLRQQLFVHRDLWAWLDDPFQPPPPPPEEQLALALA